MIRYMLQLLGFGSSVELPHPHKGIVVRSDGSAYRTAESINEMVREYLKEQEGRE